MLSEISPQNKVLNVSLAATYEITLLLLSICPCLSVCPPSPNVLKIGSLVFSDIVYDDMYRWYKIVYDDI